MAAECANQCKIFGQTMDLVMRPQPNLIGAQKPEALSPYCVSFTELKRAMNCGLSTISSSLPRTDLRIVPLKMTGAPILADCTVGKSLLCGRNNVAFV